MKTLTIVRLGHPALRKKSKRVALKEVKEAKFQRFLDQMEQTCIAANGAGIAAPQVGVNKRIIVINVQRENPRYPNKGDFPLTTVINPVIQKTAKKKYEDWEGDLSACLMAKVPRSISCTVSGIDRQGNKVIFDVKDFIARVFQHEIDHLDGIFLTDRIVNKNTLTEVLS